MSTILPSRPRLVLRAGFAGRQELAAAEATRLATTLHAVLGTLGHELAALTPGVPVRAGQEPRVAAFFARQCPLLRLITGLCQGADAVAAQTLERVHVCPDAGTTCPPDTRCLETELAAVLPFAVDTYRRSRPAEFLPEFDRQLARCAWVLALDGRYAKPDPDTAPAKLRRGRAYRAQSAFLLRHSDVLIAAANPDEPGRAGGTLETVREAQVLELPVVFLHTATGAVHLLEPEDDLHSVLAEPAPSPEEWTAKLRQWVNQLVADPDHGLAPDSHGHHDARAFGEALLTEYFDAADSPAKAAAGRLVRFRKWAWDWFERRFKTRERLTGDPKLAPFAVPRDRATALNYHYGGLYRGAFLLNYVAAITAVILAAVSLALLGTGGHTPLGEELGNAVAKILPAAEPAGAHAAAAAVVSTRPAPWLHPVLFALALVKLGIVVFISINTRTANREQWNDRAVDFRYLAERLRAMYYLPLAGSHQPPAAAPPQFASRAVRQSAVDWLFEALVRASSPADLASAGPGTCGAVPIRKLVTLRPLAVVETVRDAWIAEQARYHDRNARTMHALHHAFEQAAVGLGWTVIGVVGIDLLLVGAELLHWLPPAWEPAVKTATPWLIFTTAVLPAVVAALGGIRFQSECQRLAERSAVMRVMLVGRPHHPPAAKPAGWRRLWAPVAALGKAFWHVLRHLFGRPPAPAPVALVGGRWALADRLARRLARQQANPAEDPGSGTHDAPRLTERVATDFVQEAAEWSVLYAKEVSDPG